MTVTAGALAKRLRRLPALPPMTASLERALFGPDLDRSTVWYSSQKEHWLGWLAQYDGPGAYGRKVHKGRSAEFIYNHVVNPPMVFWLGEAAGLPKTQLLAVRRAAIAATPTMMSQSAAIRRAIPWRDIESALF